MNKKEAKSSKDATVKAAKAITKDDKKNKKETSVNKTTVQTQSKGAKDKKEQNGKKPKRSFTDEGKNNITYIGIENNAVKSSIAKVEKKAQMMKEAEKAAKPSRPVTSYIYFATEYVPQVKQAEGCSHREAMVKAG